MHMKPKTVITYGTFDMFHIGHLNLLRRIKEMGDELIVGVSTDAFNELKGKQTLIPYEQRAQIVEAIRYVDRVIPEENWEQKADDIRRYDVDLFVIGEDWRGEFDFLEELCEVRYIERTENISTTQLKQSLEKFLSVGQDDVARAFEILHALKRDFE